MNAASQLQFAFGLPQPFKPTTHIAALLSGRRTARWMADCISWAGTRFAAAAEDLIHALVEDGCLGLPVVEARALLLHHEDAGVIRRATFCPSYAQLAVGCTGYGGIWAKRHDPVRWTWRGLERQ